MPSAHLRRSLGALTVAGLGLAGVPLLGSAAASSDVALVSAYPTFGGSVISGGETLRATYNEAISQDKNVSWFKVRTVADGEVGNEVRGGTYDITSSTQNGPKDSITFTGPLGVAGAAAEYQAQVRATSADGTSSTTNSFFFWVDPRAPRVTSAPSSITGDNQKAVTFTGTAAPGLTVHVDVLPSSNTSPVPPPAVASGTATVPTTCGTAPNCAWTVTVDASNLPDYTYYWWAYTTDANTSSPMSPNPPRSISKGTHSSTAPPSNVQAKMDSKSPTTMDVTACSTDPRTTKSWTFDVVTSDQEGHTLLANGLPTVSGQSGCPFGLGLSTAIDVGRLDDGSLTPTAYAVDDKGAISSGTQGSPVTKAVGLDLDFADSALATPSRPTVSFPTAQAQLVQSPTSVQLRFTQPVKASFTDNMTFPPKTYGSTVCIADRTGSCVVYTTSPAISQDGFTMTVPVSGALVDSFAPYTIRVQTYEKNLCPDRNPGTSNPGTAWQCYTPYTRPSGTAQDGTAPAADPTKIAPVTIRQSIDPSAATFEFRLDDLAPAVRFTSFSPSTITGATDTKVSITGTTDSDATAVRVVIKSSGGGTPVIVDIPVTPSSDPNVTTLSWAASDVNLSGVPDGTLRVTATATDAAGNRTPKPVTLDPRPALRAHPSTLTEYTSARTVVYGRAIRLHGLLTDTTSRAGIGSAALTIRPQFDNGRFGAMLTTATDRYGYWSRTVTPAQNATYWVTYAGTTSAPLHGEVVTRTARTLVRVRIVFTSPAYGAQVGSPVTLKGQVSPNKRGYYVYLYRYTAHRNFFLGRVRLSSRSTWSFKVSLPRGTDYVYAQISNTAGNLGNRTALLRFVR